jgi:hypothetical protein
MPAILWSSLVEGQQVCPRAENSSNASWKTVLDPGRAQPKMLLRYFPFKAPGAKQLGNSLSPDYRP